MSVAVLVFPGTNSEDETLRACVAAGIDTDLVHWSTDLDRVRAYDAYVLPGGFAYEDRVRAGAIAAHDHLMIAVREGAEAGKPVLGICNGAQILLEAGLVPQLNGEHRVQAGFMKNAPSGKFQSRHVYVKLAIAPERCSITASLDPHAVIPAWVSNGEGRLAAQPDVLERMRQEQCIAFVYCDESGNAATEANPNGSALGAAAVTNVRGNVLAIMPHPERDAWTFMHHDESRESARGDALAMLAPSGGIALFTAFAAAIGVRVPAGKR
jgi:phosphoribosylformylglycinamidine synthase subunit PurQ / glutaminase